MSEIFDGVKLAKAKREFLRQELSGLVNKHKRTPKLVSIMIGDDPASGIYSSMQEKEALAIGIDFELIKMVSGTKRQDLIKKIQALNKDESIDGVFIHQPLPDSLSTGIIRGTVLPSKDVECEHPFNLGRLVNSCSLIVPPTPAAILHLIKETKLDVYGKEVVIIGHSSIVGKPTALLLLDKLATVTVTHIATFEVKMLESHIKQADILISAVGKPGLIKAEWIKEGACVIDVGIVKTPEGIKGDVDFKGACGKVGFITPVPGGVGPLTVVFLMKNLITLYKQRYEEK